MSITFSKIFRNYKTYLIENTIDLICVPVDNDEFGRAARRGKVDLLGLTLKKRIEQIRLVGQAELVFLVDSSASVGSDNFYNEIKFIRKVNYLHFFAVKKK